MTKQEEIREGIRPFFCECCEPADKGCSVYDGQCSMVDYALPKLLAYLHDNDVAIKVDRELPENEYIYPEDSTSHVTDRMEKAWNHAQRNMLKAGYVAVEPLIE